MGLEKAIIHKKEHRKEYFGSKRFDAWCRNHGKCEFCRRNRTHKEKRDLERMKDLENSEDVI